MVDQLQVHGQFKINLLISDLDAPPLPPHVTKTKYQQVNRFSEHQEQVLSLVGGAIGKCLKPLIEVQNCYVQEEIMFSCPLDESLTTCYVSIGSVSRDFKPPTYCNRTKLGCLNMTCFSDTFFTSVNEALSPSLSLDFEYCREGNGHHVIESSFKAFGRGVRKYIDADNQLAKVDGDVSAPHIGGIRHAEKTRQTKETKISVQIDLDKVSILPAPENSTPTIQTGIPVFDHLLGIFFKSFLGDKYLSFLTDDGPLKLHCAGDLWIDDHHTIEDVGITLGQTFLIALGNKAGIARMGSGTFGNGAVRIVVDVSGRGGFFSDVDYRTEEFISFADMGGSDDVTEGPELSSEMLEHFFDSFINTSLVTVHFVRNKNHDQSLSAFDWATLCMMGFGEVMGECCKIDVRRGTVVASSKGTLAS